MEHSRFARLTLAARRWRVLGDRRLLCFSVSAVKVGTGSVLGLVEISVGCVVVAVNSSIP